MRARCAAKPGSRSGEQAVDKLDQIVFGNLPERRPIQWRDLFEVAANRDDLGFGDCAPELCLILGDAA